MSLALISYNFPYNSNPANIKKGMEYCLIEIPFLEIITILF
jgi:hypothetical protein